MPLKKSFFILSCVASLIGAGPGTALFHGTSQRGINPKQYSPETAKSRAAMAIPTRAKIYALRVEFQLDEDYNTTGNGAFLRGSQNEHPGKLHLNDTKEFRWYASDTVYPYDRLPHDSLYFTQHLDYLVSYFSLVSKGTLSLEYELFPKGQYQAYRVPLKMALYSPGAKRDTETYDDFYVRTTSQLMKFVRDAIFQMDTASTLDAPFKNLVMDSLGHLYEVDGLSGDSTLVILQLLHAGASSLTDGGYSGAPNSSSDLQDLFITSEHFDYFRENFGTSIIDTPVTGMKVTGKEGIITISELMMVSETANQDSLNFGINGIMVNQLARQLGLPDLYNTSNGISSLGGFCIMDFAGYSRAQGFIPPYPSAWTRLYAGWDTAIVVTDTTPLVLNAVGSSLGNTLYKIPLNAHEYWLVENRQRNTTTDELFLYDTTNGIRHISQGNQVNITAAVDSVTPDRGVIISAKSQDIGIPASGGLLWHIDERLITNRQTYNLINSDSTFRGVALEEADGIIDIGITFANALGSSVYDYGGAEDLFPHRASHSSNTPVMSIGSTTRPSTQANDGGHTFKTITLKDTGTVLGFEKYAYNRSESNKKYSNYFVEAYRAPSLSLKVTQETQEAQPVNGWPKVISEQRSYDPLWVEKHLYILDSSGNLFIFDSLGTITPSANVTVRSNGDSIPVSGKITRPFTFPTAMGNRVMIPTVAQTIYTFKHGESPQNIATSDTLSTWIVAPNDSSWVVGTSHGRILWGTNLTEQKTLTLDTSDIVALALFDQSQLIYSAITASGKLFLFSENGVIAQTSLTQNSMSTFTGPFGLANGDLNGDTVIEVVVTDIRQGLWIFEGDLTDSLLVPHPEVSRFPIDWSGYFRTDTTRTAIPTNGALPSLSDIDGDGTLEILISGTNGVYAFNHRGVLMEGWPAQLNRAQWSIRKSVISSPVTALTNDTLPLTLFTVPTGDKQSYYVTKADSIHVDEKKIYFTDYLGKTDSLEDLSQGFIDSTIGSKDSLILPYYAPGGLVDARLASGKRPSQTLTTPNSGKLLYSSWPLTLGAPSSTSPLVVTEHDKSRLFSLNDEGMIYQWIYDTSDLKTAAHSWSTTGGTQSRLFYVSPAQGVTETSISPSSFYSYPNPIRVNTTNNASVGFRYTLGETATKVTLTIYTITGKLIFKDDQLPTTMGVQEYRLSDLSRFGSAAYHCFLVVKGSKESTLQWKMAVLRGAQ